MLILAIETSCDETSVAVVRDGREVLSNVIASQISKHVETGGVVPEVAAREHIKVMMPVLREAMKEAGVDWKDIDAIAVTKEPGLIGSLIVGRITAAALAFAKDKRLIEVNHIHGHMYSTWLLGEQTRSKTKGPTKKVSVPAPEYPILVLTVSGGHNELVLMEVPGKFLLLAESVDDAAGEAYDKVARLLGLGYPGGPVIEERAKLGNPKAVKFPIGLPQGKNFSFSGLKTAVLYHLKENEGRLNDVGFVNDVAASFQEAVVDALVKKLMRAVKTHNVVAPPRYCLADPSGPLPVKEVHLTGGVSANRLLRGRIEEELSHLAQAPLFRVPQEMSYCTDNAAMIGAAAYQMNFTK